jgi:hypothetical protein
MPKCPRRGTARAGPRVRAPARWAAPALRSRGEPKLLPRAARTRAHHHARIAGRTHALRSALALSDGAGANWIELLAAERRRALDASFRALRRDGADAAAELARVLTPIVAEGGAPEGVVSRQASAHLTAPRPAGLRPRTSSMNFARLRLAARRPTLESASKPRPDQWHGATPLPAGSAALPRFDFPRRFAFGL